MLDLGLDQAVGPWGLFLVSFLSSTLLPGGSELALTALLLEQRWSPALLFAVATLGNTLGGMTNWLLGHWLARRLPPEGANRAEPRRRKALERVRRYGAPVLLLSWLPVIGDPLCFAAGWLRVGWWRAFVFVALGKAGRYGVLVYLVG